ncbi:MAG: PfkB family carbohydrate kinase [Demequina sp.]|nr:PfkB family carbohydrate kinase [Demequina sp.]
MTAAGEHASSPPVDSPGLFPVGSGDCFLAGLVSALERGLELGGALAVAARVGAANAQVPGAAVFDVPELSPS